MRLTANLTKRETQIAELLAWGSAKKEVANNLNISIRTVENTTRNIYEKIGIQKATELSVWWFLTKAGVSISLDPLKRKFVAIALLAIITPYIFIGGNDIYRRVRNTNRTTIEIRYRARGRRNEEITL